MLGHVPSIDTGPLSPLLTELKRGKECIVMFLGSSSCPPSPPVMGILVIAHLGVCLGEQSALLPTESTRPDPSQDSRGHCDINNSTD